MEKDEDKRPPVWLHFRVPAEMHDELRAMAERERRSLSQMTMLVLDDCLAARRDGARHGQ